MAQLRCTVVTPEATVLEETVDYLVLPLFDGEIGIAPLHGPMIGRMGFGEMRIKQGEKTSTYYVDGGFVQVTGENVSVLTNHAIRSDQLDVQEAEKSLDAARNREAHSEQGLQLRERAEAQARAKLRVAQRADQFRK